MHIYIYVYVQTSMYMYVCVGIQMTLVQAWGADTFVGHLGIAEPEGGSIAGGCHTISLGSLREVLGSRCNVTPIDGHLL